MWNAFPEEEREALQTAVSQSAENTNNVMSLDEASPGLPLGHTAERRRKPSRLFQGKDTRQIDGHTTQPAEPDGWYYEPSDYEGDTLWSPPYPTREAAEAAAEAQIEDEPPLPQHPCDAGAW